MSKAIPSKIIGKVESLLPGCPTVQPPPPPELGGVGTTTAAMFTVTLTVPSTE
jgi:hypothetical protein